MPLVHLAHRVRFFKPLVGISGNRRHFRLDGVVFSQNLEERYGRHGLVFSQSLEEKEPRLQAEDHVPTENQLPRIGPPTLE